MRYTHITRVHTMVLTYSIHDGSDVCVLSDILAQGLEGGACHRRPLTLLRESMARHVLGRLGLVVELLLGRSEV
jgi:hypothetical protein